jgi:outer membrane protein OmpA-like peptidoglycan-associated protein
MVSDATTEVIEVPAEYASRSFKKIASNASSSVSQADNVFASRSFKKLVSDASAAESRGDIQYTSVSMQKLSGDAQAIPVYGGPQYTTRSMQKLASDATFIESQGDSRYTTYSYQKLASDATTEDLPCAGTSTTLDVKFATASAVLTGNSNVEIDRVVGMMTSDASMTAKIVGHTDSDGSESSNLTLSRNRAKAVYDALVAKGINTSRLSYEGKGESAPIASNASASGKAQNRRTELISYGTGENDDCKSYKTRSFQTLASDASHTEVRGDDVFASRSFQRLANDASTQVTEVPTAYESRTYQKLASDASYTENSTPAEYTNRSYQKLANNATTESTPVPVSYKTRTYTRTSPATTETINIPAEYRTITKRNLVKPGGFTEWREVVCEADITQDLVRSVQSALISRGYSVGSAGADNQMGAATKAALVKFQKDNNLPVGQLDIETLRALGVK